MREHETKHFLRNSVAQGHVLNYPLEAKYFFSNVYPFERANKLNLNHENEHFSLPFFPLNAHY